MVRHAVPGGRWQQETFERHAKSREQQRAGKEGMPSNECCCCVEGFFKNVTIFEAGVYRGGNHQAVAKQKKVVNSKQKKKLNGCRQGCQQQNRCIGIGKADVTCGYPAVNFRENSGND